MTNPSLANLLGAAAVAVRDRIDESLKQAAGLQGKSPAAVLTIGTRPGRPIKHLSRSLDLSHSGTVRLVDRLETRGWVIRRASPDRREVHLELAEGGEHLFEELLAARRAALRELLDPVPAPEREPLERALAALLAGLPSSREEAWQICRLCEHRACRGGNCPVGSAVDERERPD